MLAERQTGHLETAHVGATTTGHTAAVLEARRARITRQLGKTDDEIAEILRRSAKILGIAVTPESLMEIARRSRATPRTANYLLKRGRDFAEVAGSSLDIKTVKKALALLEVDELGLNQIDRDILSIIVDKFQGGPVGLKTIAAALSEEEAAIEEVHEPYLMQIGLLERTPRGRTVTDKGYLHIGATKPGGSTTKRACPSPTHRAGGCATGMACRCRLRSSPRRRRSRSRRSTRRRMPRCAAS